jgi:lysophospholipase L1-like esterase
MKKKIFFALCTTIFVLGLAELVARSFVSPSGAKVHVHSGKTSRTDWFGEQRGQISALYQHRSTGSFPPTMYRERIAVLGGSSVHGGSNNLSGRQEFPALLGNKIGVEVINLGNPSLDSHDLSSILEELQSYPMSAWVVYTGHNDFGNTYFHQRYKGWSGLMGAYMELWMSRSALYQGLRRGLNTPEGNTAQPNPKKQFSGPYITQAQKVRALSYFQENIERMVWLAQKNKIPIIFVVPLRDVQRAPLGGCHEKPCSLELYDEGISLRSSDPERALDLLDRAADADEVPLRVISDAQDFLRSLEGEGVYVVDTPLQLKEELSSGALFQDHVHLTAEGHKRVSDVLSDALNGIVGR